MRAPEEALEAPYAAALAGLPGMGPATLSTILEGWTPKEAWERIAAGSLRGPVQRRPAVGKGVAQGHLWDPDDAAESRDGPGSWRFAARRIDPVVRWGRLADRGIRVTWPALDTYPAILRVDPERPAVLFSRGSLALLERPCVALVGTRSATPDGRSIAYEMGRDLSAAGVCVVSGLALGIDGAAHTGALDGSTAPGGVGPAGVAASGVDVPYPRRHRVLWERVAYAGVVVSETLPGSPPDSWRFPARNRIIAALSRIVVVVESHIKGGSLITADAAIARGIEVRAVPGPVHSSAAEGSNQLLYDGVGPVRDARDVLDALGMVMPDRDTAATEGLGVNGVRGRADQLTSTVVRAMDWHPMSLGQIVDRTRLPVGEAMAALERAQALGLVVEDRGHWSRRR